MYVTIKKKVRQEVFWCLRKKKSSFACKQKGEGFAFP
jgi:hypothetical protein